MLGVIISYILGFVLSIAVFIKDSLPIRDMGWTAFGWLLGSCLIVGLLWPAWVVIYVSREPL